MMFSRMCSCFSAPCAHLHDVKEEQPSRQDGDGRLRVSTTRRTISEYGARDGIISTAGSATALGGPAESEAGTTAHDSEYLDARSYFSCSSAASGRRRSASLHSMLRPDQIPGIGEVVWEHGRAVRRRTTTVMSAAAPPPAWVPRRTLHSLGPDIKFVKPPPAIGIGGYWEKVIRCGNIMLCSCSAVVP